MQGTPRFGLVRILIAVLASATSAPAETFVVTKESDGAEGKCDADCSLRDAIRAANLLPGRDTIIIPAGTFILSVTGQDEDAALRGDLDLTDDAELIGAGAARTAVDGNGLDRVFHVLPGAEVTIDGLTVGGGGSPFYTGDGAGVLNSGKLTLFAVIVSDNQVGVIVDGHGGENGDEGGGVANNGDMAIISSSIHHNQSDQPGGGISNSGSLRIEDSAIFANSALYAGGGISNSAELAIVSSTVAGNGVENDGGGIFNSGDLTLEGCTVADNGAASTSGGHLGGGISNMGRARLRNTILAGNTAGGGQDCSGVLESLGHNLVGDLTGCGFVPLASDIIGDPGLGGLASRETPGGAHLPLLAWSPAVDAGDPGACSPVDQIGQPRVDVCDIGAVELRASCNGETVIEAGGASSTFLGYWRLSEAPGFHGTNSFWSKDGRCVLRASLSRGTYEVYEWHTIWPSRAIQVSHQILHTGDLREIYIDQSKNGARWNSLGLYDFSGDPGERASAQVTITASNGERSTNADAVRFVCRSLEPPVAVIDDVTPQRSVAGTEFCFAGHGAGSFPIVEYEWSSSIEGVLSTSDRFCTRGLTAGTHTLAFQVMDASGAWSPASIVRVLVEPATCTTDIVVDAGVAGTTLRGSWRPSESPGFYGTGSLWSKYSGSGSFPTATLSADLPPGQYEVFEWHTVWSTRTRTARHVIQHAGGSTTLNVDQSVNGGRWNRLGVFTFTGRGSVSIGAIDRERSTNADAIRFKCRP